MDTGGNQNQRHVNPLNGGYGSGGSSGLGGYGDLFTAASDTAACLASCTAGNGYGTVTSDLKQSASISVTASAIWSSPWASSHYAIYPNNPKSWGSEWHTGPVTVVSAPAYLWYP